MTEGPPPAETPAPGPGPVPLPLPLPSDTARVRRETQDDVTSALRAPFLRPLLRLPLKKVAIWAGFLFALWLLRGFFGIILLTFVLSYIASSIVARLSSRFSTRKVPVVLVFGGLVGAIVGMGFASVPALKRNLEKANQVLGRTAQQFEASRKEGRDPRQLIDERVEEFLADNPRLKQVWAYVGPHGLGMDEGLKDALAPESLKGHVLPLVQSLIKGIWVGVVTVLMSLLFSFMIVWDAPRLTQGVERLKHTRLGEVWIEVAPSIATFGRLLGKAFEAQSAIACLNTFLTAIGMWALGIPGSAIGFLSIIVFVCSFVPIVGVWVSTLPICVVAAQAGGLPMVVGSVVMVVIVHIVEAYVLNPRIYGAHLKLHPVVVLMVLFMGEQMLGLWGLVLGVPLATYVWRHLILGEAEYVYPPALRPGPAPHPVAVAVAPEGGEG